MALRWEGGVAGRPLEAQGHLAEGAGWCNLVGGCKRLLGDIEAECHKVTAGCKEQGQEQALGHKDCCIGDKGCRMVVVRQAVVHKAEDSNSVEELQEISLGQ